MLELKEYLKKRWDITAKITLKKMKENGEGQYILELSVEETKKLLKIIMPYLEEKSMLYKFMLTYKTGGNQEA